MKLIQKPGEEKLLISKQKALSTNLFCMKIYFLENRLNFLFSGKSGSLELPVSFCLNLLLLQTPS